MTNKIYKLLIITLFLIGGGNALKAQGVGDSFTKTYNEGQATAYTLTFTVTKTNPNECEITGSTNPSSPTSLTIPENVDGYGVTSIGNNAFHMRSGFTGDLTIPNSVTSIGTWAFYYCKGFTGPLTIGNSVTSIGNWAFANCSGFTGDLIIPNSVISIGECAFYGCAGFTGSLTIGNSVTSIRDHAFYECKGFTGSLTIPNSVTSIGFWAFHYCKGFTGSLTIGNSVTSIGGRAFSDCSGFTGSLTIPESVTSIGDYAFIDCNGFKGSLTIPNSVTSIGTWAFQNCNNFTDVYSFSENAPSLGAENVFSCSDATLHYLASAEQSYDEKGWFNYFNKRQAYDSDSDGFIIIDSKEDLIAFANLVNTGNKGLNARLHSDIDLENMEWSPICSTALYYVTTPYPDAGYLGTFDGNGHVISNLNITGTAEDASFGLFGTLSGTVRNLGIENFTFTGAGGDTRVGAVIGQMLDGSLVENCYAANGNINTQVNTENGVAGGIAGCNYAATVKNSFSYNFTITAGRYGGIVGDNCGDIKDIVDRPGVLENCYTDYGTFHHAKNSGTSATGNANVTEDQFASGEIAYLLQGEQENHVWGQNIDNGETPDAYPVLNGAKVYMVKNCNNDDVYSNANEDKGHNHINGICPICGDIIVSVPENLIAEAISTSSISLSWDAAENALSYNIYQGEELIGQQTTDNGQQSLSYLVENLEYYTEYCFTVTAVNGEKESEKSEETCVKTLDLPITAPENLVAVPASTSEITLSWDAVENALSYNIYQGEELIGQLSESESLSYLVENLEYDTEYCFTVTAVRNETETEKSEEACVKTLGEGVEELTTSLLLYPNPAKDEVRISSAEMIKEVRIYSITGIMVYNVECRMNNVELNVDDLSDGVYFVKVRTEKGESVQRFIKK